MRRCCFALSLTIASAWSLAFGGATRVASAQETALRYPSARQSDQADDYHGTLVRDPFRWLEDTDSPETRAWIEAQNQLTEGYLADAPGRDWLRQRLTKLWDFERFGVPLARGGRYFITRNDGLQNQSVLYVQSSLEGEARELLDPNKLSADGTVALAGWEPSDDGKLLAYGLANAGSDWREWKVRNVETGQDLSDHLQWVKFSGVSWTPDGQGFFYSRYDEPKPGQSLLEANYYQKLYHHKLGQPQSEDKLIYERRDEKEWGFGGYVTEDGQYLIISVRRGAEPKDQLFYLDLKQADAKVVELITGFDAQYNFLGNEGPVFWIHTDWQAPRGRIVAVDTRRPERDAWKEVVPQTTETIAAATLVGERFIVNYLKDAYSQVKLFQLSGQFDRELPLSGIGTVDGFTGRRPDEQTFYAYTSFTTPPTIYRYDFAANQANVFRAPKVDFDPASYETKQIFYPSKDGTRVPMFITAKKGLERDGQSPTLLYGYGGFDISITPSFSVGNAVWLELGGIYAVPNLRGGGEYGRAWHEAGRREKKQTVFDDFIAAAEFLIAQRYTSSDKLAIIGRSNGGLLVGACMTQRPELFAAALPGVGVMDMLRFHKFTIGWAWVPEFGSADDAEAYGWLSAYSPLHNLKPGTQYPATLVETADHDDRVVPGHSFKFTAALQQAQSGGAPTLARIETRAGHGAGTPTAKLIDEATDRLSFLLKVLGVAPPADR
jgi:prolyl oligopeptidase